MPPLRVVLLLPNALEIGGLQARSQGDSRAERRRRPRDMENDLMEAPYAPRGTRLLVVISVSAALLLSAPAAAQGPSPLGGGNSQPSVKTVPHGEAETTDSGAVDAADASREADDSLPFTDDDVAGLVALGLLGLSGGTALVLRSRRAAATR